jgi:hypothetical protein
MVYFWYMEFPNAVQNWRNNILAFVTKTVGCRLTIAALQGTIWQGKNTVGMQTHTLLYSGKEKGTRQFGVA